MRRDIKLYQTSSSPHSIERSMYFHWSYLGFWNLRWPQIKVATCLEHDGLIRGFFSTLIDSSNELFGIYLPQSHNPWSPWIQASRETMLAVTWILGSKVFSDDRLKASGSQGITLRLFLPPYWFLGGKIRAPTFSNSSTHVAIAHRDMDLYSHVIGWDGVWETLFFKDTFIQHPKIIL